ncbi:MAG: IS4 family transposase [Oligoflexia bacterium]|nr:IS4 family transposase [Oligoflexia bacterium]
MQDITSFEKLHQCFLSILPQKDKACKVVSPYNLITCLVFVFSTVSSTMISLADFRKILMTNLNVKISRPTIRERLTTCKIQKLLINLLYELMARLARKKIRGEDIMQSLGVKSILMIDSTTVSLWNSVKDSFPGTFTTAGIKWHACYDLFSGVLQWFDITPSSTNDSQCFPTYEMLVGKLIIFDLGYWSRNLFFELDDAGCYFLSRLKKGFCILVEGVVSGLGQKYIGAGFSTVIWSKYHGEIVEFIGGISINDKHKTFRIIGFWNETEITYHWHITNLLVPAILIYPCYSLRWQIELCQTHYHQNENFYLAA